MGGTPVQVFNGLSVKTRLILIPCSLSVSEYNPVSSATNSSGEKQHFGTFGFDAGAPDLILLDPVVAATAPPDKLWLPSGVRAIDHCVETMWNSRVSDDNTQTSVDGLRALIRGLSEYKSGLDVWQVTRR